MGCREPLDGPGSCGCNRPATPPPAVPTLGQLRAAPATPPPAVPTLGQLRAARDGDLNVTLAEDGTVIAATLAGDAIPRALGEALLRHVDLVRLPSP